MDELLLNLQACIENVNEWIPKGTMLELYSFPNTTNSDMVCNYDLTSLIGYGRSYHNTKFITDGVSSRIRIFYMHIQKISWC